MLNSSSQLYENRPSDVNSRSSITHLNVTLPVESMPVEGRHLDGMLEASNGMDSDASESAALAPAKSNIHVWIDRALLCLSWIWIFSYVRHVSMYPEMLQFGRKRLVEELFVDMDEWTRAVQVIYTTWVLLDCLLVVCFKLIKLSVGLTIDCWETGSVGHGLLSAFNCVNCFYTRLLQFVDNLCKSSRAVTRVCGIVLFDCYALLRLIAQLGWKTTNFCLDVMLLTKQIIIAITTIFFDLYRLSRGL
jgi:hypothetical protein